MEMPHGTSAEDLLNKAREVEDAMVKTKTHHINAIDTQDPKEEDDEDENNPLTNADAERLCAAMGRLARQIGNKNTKKKTKKKDERTDKRKRHLCPKCNKWGFHKEQECRGPNAGPIRSIDTDEADQDVINKLAAALNKQDFH